MINTSPFMISFLALVVSDWCCCYFRRISQTKWDVAFSVPVTARSASVMGAIQSALPVPLPALVIPDQTCCCPVSCQRDPLPPNNALLAPWRTEPYNLVLRWRPLGAQQLVWLFFDLDLSGIPTISHRPGPPPCFVWTNAKGTRSRLRYCRPDSAPVASRCPPLGQCNQRNRKKWPQLERWEAAIWRTAESSSRSRCIDWLGFKRFEGSRLQNFRY